MKTYGFQSYSQFAEIDKSPTLKSREGIGLGGSTVLVTK